MNDILKLIELCEKESDEHYSVNFTIDKYGVQIKGYYYPEPGLIPTFNFSDSFTKNSLMCAAPGLDIHHCCKYEIGKFKQEVREEMAEEVVNEQASGEEKAKRNGKV